MGGARPGANGRAVGHDHAPARPDSAVLLVALVKFQTLQPLPHAQGTKCVLNLDRHDSISKVTQVCAARAMFKSNLIVKKCGNERGTRQYHLRLAALLQFAARTAAAGVRRP